MVDSTYVNNVYYMLGPIVFHHCDQLLCTHRVNIHKKNMKHEQSTSRAQTNKLDRFIWRTKQRRPSQLQLCAVSCYKWQSGVLTSRFTFRRSGLDQLFPSKRSLRALKTIQVRIMFVSFSDFSSHPHSPRLNRVIVSDSHAFVIHSQFG